MGAEAKALTCVLMEATGERSSCGHLGLLRVIKAIVQEGNVYSGLLITRTHLINF